MEGDAEREMTRMSPSRAWVTAFECLSFLPFSGSRTLCPNNRTEKRACSVKPKAAFSRLKNNVKGSNRQFYGGNAVVTIALKHLR